MKAAPGVRGKEGAEIPFHFISGFSRGEAESMRQAKDMGINGKGMRCSDLTENNIGGFAADTGERGKLFKGSGHLV